MRAIDAALLSEIVQGGKAAIVEAAAPALAAGALAAGLTTPLRTAHFLAQIAYESDYFQRLEEDLDYSSPTRIAQEWPHLTDRARDLVHNPVALANAAYGLADGNRGEETGEGWLYRGRGLIQLTGRWNYMYFGSRIRTDLLTDPDRAADPAIAARTALSYWDARGCNASADADDTEAVTRRIAGSAAGVDDRARLKRRALALLTAPSPALAVASTASPPEGGEG